MAFRLVCISDALGHLKGEIIADAEKVRDYLASDVSHHFVRHEVADEAPAAEPHAI